MTAGPTRRASLPGADELFRSTGPAAASLAADPAVAPVAVPVATAVAAPAGGPSRPARLPGRKAAEREPSGRERHEEKITVYVSGAELVDLERARLVLRAEHGLGVDRGRIVREALAVVLADLDAKGHDSILVRRLRG